MHQDMAVDCARQRFHVKAGYRNAHRNHASLYVVDDKTIQDILDGGLYERTSII